MINDHNQRQEAGSNSTNYQAKEINIFQGISVRDAKDIAIDVYSQNFIKLSENAAQVALARVERFIDEFLVKLQSTNASLLDRMNEPSIQNSLYSAQKQYAITGDEKQKNILLNFMVQRCESEERGIHQIVLDEAINIISKLTSEQMDVLTLSFVICRLMDNEINNFNSFLTHIDLNVLPFISVLDCPNSMYEHLAYLGVATIEFTGRVPQLYNSYRERYAAVFSKGLSPDEVNQFKKDTGISDEYFIGHHELPLSLQLAALNKNSLLNACDRDGVSMDVRDKLSALLLSNTMNGEEAKAHLIKYRPSIADLFSKWDNSLISHINITPVGVAIAQANLLRKTGKHLSLELWLKN
ncbi:LPO_1073/Vpar_1526 family protein [Aeromonas sp. s4]|uniref:LPO_1073/Vpar_1526 family protein n=1 Tax=Aeromonas sp. s4 TaxID=3138486 RepID=UPI0034A3CFCE